MAPQSTILERMTEQLLEMQLMDPEKQASHSYSMALTAGLIWATLRTSDCRTSRLRLGSSATARQTFLKPEFTVPFLAMAAMAIRSEYNTMEACFLRTSAR